MSIAIKAAGRRFARGALPALGLLVSGCSGEQSAMDPAGPQAARIYGLWLLYLGVCVVIYGGVLLLVLRGALRRGQSGAPEGPDLAPPADRERWLVRSVAGAVALTVVILFVLMIGDFATGRAIRSLADPDTLTIRLTGHQWWWEVRYEDSTPSRIVTTANEIHIPVGRAVQVELLSADVIHSFWVPNLHGKRDMIPGHPTRVYLKADRPGTFKGQCAEFCGYQHANMRFVVVAEPEEQFGRWLDARRQPAAEPVTEGQRRGRQVFLGSTCLMCHAIRGTVAMSRAGPELTHIGDRPLIGCVVPNTRGDLAGWIVDPQHLKPGVKMPLNPLRPEELNPLLDYLESLK